MPDGGTGVTVRGVGGIAEIDGAAWDACAGDDNPFLSHAFLKALEDSGCVSEKAGWTPNHLVAEYEQGRVLGCAPLYLKAHSYG